MCGRSTLPQLKIHCVWLFGLNHWTKAGVKSNDMVIPVLTVHCCCLEQQECSHTRYRVTQNMCIIYRMSNDCLCWLFLATVDIIRDWFLQVNELPFCAGIELGRCTAPSYVFSQPHGKKNRSFGVIFMISRVNAYSEWNWCTGLLKNISHVPFLTWPGMTSSFTSHGWVNDITQHFP